MSLFGRYPLVIDTLRYADWRWVIGEEMAGRSEKAIATAAMVAARVARLGGLLK